MRHPALLQFREFQICLPLLQLSEQFRLVLISLYNIIKSICHPAVWMANTAVHSVIPAIFLDFFDGNQFVCARGEIRLL